MSLRKLPPYIFIVGGIVFGAAIGLLAVAFDFTDFVANWIKPFGEIFIRALKFIAIPLVLFSLIKGIGMLQSMERLASIGLRSLALYMGSTVIAITLGVLLVSAIRPGDVVTERVEIATSHSDAIASRVESVGAATEGLTNVSPLQPIVDIIPENAFAALANNGSMLQVIFIALLIGVATIMVGATASKPFLDVVSSVDLIITKCIDIVMGFAPLGVLSLIATMVCENSGNMSLLGAVGLYFLTVVIALMSLMVIFYPLVISTFTKIRYFEFMRAMFPVQLMGFSTSSSAATLATTMKMTDEVLHLPKSVTSFTLPLGVTINMDGTSIYQAIAAIFIAQVMDVDLSFLQILTIILTTTISSVGTPGVPGGSVVILMMVLSSVGIPPEGLALIMGVDRPLDMLRTSVNVTGDVAVSALISQREV